ncbi:FxsA family protein [Spirillospora sp. NBC_01491]|uniref:FxsA family protein n=1 Tax=Spirillospora sp. NBC_01491 TaxID=2976007 RepID=UPI002E37D839|nr:FxsA family protein [Spirillospora sp. NBC_01491]
MLPLVLVLAFLLMPALEIYVIIQVGQAIGGWWTVLLLLAGAAVGAWIVRREGRRAWRALQDAFQRGAMTDRRLADAALVLAGGVLIAVPGFVTDVVGLLFVLPFTRPLVRRPLARFAERRMRAAEARGAMMFPPGTTDGGFGPAGPRGRSDADGGASVPRGPVVRGEVVHDDDRPSQD